MINKLPHNAQLVLSAMRLREQGKMIESMDVALNGLSNYPEDIQLMQVVAEGYVALGLFHRALGIYEKLQKEDKMENEDEFNLSSTYLSMNMFIKAQNYALKLLKKYPDNYEVYFQAGNTYERMNMLQTALSYFDQSYKLNKSFKRSLLGKLRCLQKLGRHEELDNDVVLVPDMQTRGEIRKFIKHVETLQGTEISKVKDELIIFQQFIKSDDIAEISRIWYEKGLEYFSVGKKLHATIALDRAKIYRPDYYHYEVVYNNLALHPRNEEDFFNIQYIEGRLTDNANERMLGRAAGKIPTFDPHRFVPTRKTSNRYALTEPSDVNPQIMQQIELVKALTNKNNPLTALLLLDLILKEEPDFGVALIFKTIILKDLGKFDEAASIIFHYLSLRVEEPVILKLGIEIFTKLVKNDHVKYFQELLHAIDNSNVSENNLNHSILGVTSSMRTSQTPIIARKGNNVVERYELPRNTWNMAMHGYNQLTQGIVTGVSEMTYSLLPSHEPNYIEGRVAEAAFWMMKKNLEKAKEVINYVLSLNQNYEPALIKKEEIEKLEGGGDVMISHPMMEHKAFLSSFYYQKYFFDKRVQSIFGKSRQTKNCPFCGTVKRELNQNFCMKCGNKF